VAGPRYSEQQARAAIAASLSWSESLRRLGMCPTGGAWRVLKKYAVLWDIPTDHFRPNGRPPRPKQSLESLLVPGSKIRSSKLKPRLYAAGLKQPECELCGQGELWHGRRMSLILLPRVRWAPRADSCRAHEKPASRAAAPRGAGR
jgi:hypothetical protein